MKTNRNRSDFADAHTDLSTNAVTPIKYLIMNNYRQVYLYTYTDLSNTLTISEAGKNKPVL